MKIMDYFAIVLAVAAVSLTAVKTYAAPISNPVVQIQTADKTFFYPLTVDREITPLEDPESCRIAIESETVRVLSSNCLQEICVSMGAISYSGQWIACLPHRVFIDFIAAPDGGVDAQAY